MLVVDNPVNIVEKFTENRMWKSLPEEPIRWILPKNALGKINKKRGETEGL